ncbi:Sec-independent protein translocase protein TatB [Woodsholea maritima]|uniref:Sec-independent protein translocase protein TatB n=1 Tax=Woodsholea maritima TaxID=240237 RepID=UPI0003678583|nr:Sec-independent protein translocase protein TatB [Woodsholea maritima]
MNPGVGAPELLVILILALVVVGPKDLPLMMRKLGRYVAQAKAMAREFQRNFEELGREAEMEELRREIEALKKVNPVGDVSREINSAVREASDFRSKPAPQDTADKPRPTTAAPVRDNVGDKPHPRLPASTGADDAMPDTRVSQPAEAGIAPEADPQSSKTSQGH